MPDPTEILADWRIAEKRSSRGPWQATSENPFLPGAQIKLYDADGHEVKIEVGDERHVWRTSDADFIVAARTAMPALLAAVESVLRLHRRVPSQTLIGPLYGCEECATAWPCPTVRTITEALEGDTDAE